MKAKKTTKVDQTSRKHRANNGTAFEEKKSSMIFIIFLKNFSKLRIQDIYPWSELFPSRIQGRKDFRIPDPHPHPNLSILTDFLIIRSSIVDPDINKNVWTVYISKLRIQSVHGSRSSATSHWHVKGIKVRAITILLSLKTCVNLWRKDPPAPIIIN